MSKKRVENVKSHENTKKVLSKDLKITKKRVENEISLQRTDWKFKISKKRLEIEKSQKRLETSSYFSIKKISKERRKSLVENNTKKYSS